jgi:opacity protein-like surface antigen
MRKLFILALIALALPASLVAQDDDWRNRRGRDRGRYDDRYRYDDSMFELTPFVGYRYGGTLYADQTGFADDVKAESNPNYGINFAIPLGNQGFKLELMANRQDTHLTAGSGLFSPSDRVADFNVTYYHAGLLIPFARSRNVTPYVIVSAGVANLHPDIPDTSDENRFSASAGIGVKVPINRNFGVRAEARGYYTALPNDNGCRRCYYDYSYRDFSQGETNVGLYFRF